VELCKATRPTALSGTAPQIIFTANVSAGVPRVPGAQLLEAPPRDGERVWLRTVADGRKTFLVNVPVVANDVISQSLT
jgi:hypothetical protein